MESQNGAWSTWQNSWRRYIRSSGTVASGSSQVQDVRLWARIEHDQALVDLLMDWRFDDSTVLEIDQYHYSTREPMNWTQMETGHAVDTTCSMRSFLVHTGLECMWLMSSQLERVINGSGSGRGICTPFSCYLYREEFTILGRLGKNLFYEYLYLGAHCELSSSNCSCTRSCTQWFIFYFLFSRR